MIKSESQKRYPFRVFDSFGERIGDFHSLEAAQKWIATDNLYSDEAEVEREYYAIYQCIEDHNYGSEDM